MEVAIPRRRYLFGVLGVDSSLVAGCTDFGTSDDTVEYSLFAYPPGRWGANGEALTETFRWTPDELYAHHQRAVADELLSEGLVTTTGYQLVGVSELRGERSATPRYLESDGRFYRIRLRSTEQVTVKRWVFWLDRRDAEPTDGDLVKGVPDDLSKLDTEIVQRALSATTGEDVEDRPLRGRGYVYHQVEPTESDLVPNPPFDHIEADRDGETLYFTARPTEDTVQKQDRYTWELDEVADSTTSFEEHLRESVLAAEIRRSSLTDPERTVLQKATKRYDNTYSETKPLSDEYESVLERIGFGGIDPPPEDYVRHGKVYFKYDGNVYESDLAVYRR